jgi:hypothetical protein
MDLLSRVGRRGPAVGEHCARYAELRDLIVEWRGDKVSLIRDFR